MAVLLIVLVAGSFGAAFFAGAQPVATTSTGGVCGNIAPFDRSQEVMLIKPGSSGLVCVLYLPDPTLPSPSLAEATGVWTISANGTASAGAAGVNMTFLWSTVTHANATVAHSESAEYLVTTAPAAAGAYVWTVGGECPLFAFTLVVGDNLSGVLPNLARYSAIWSCLPGTFYAEVDGVSGITLQSPS